MPWYRAGTVSVTLNSNTVTGTGTSFSANGRVGDAWTGPDGRWYEVTNISSATVLTIAPAYLGPTTAAGIYALAPMQGYVKESADRLRQLVDQVGSTLAGLGTASTATAQIHVDDETPGRLQLTGAFGWGSQHVRTVVTDLNALTVSQKFSINADAPGVPRQLSGTLPFAAGSTGIALTWTANHQQQLVFNRTNAQIAYRYKNGGVWQPDQHLALYPAGQSFLSVAQGGTGGSTPALARAGLQLGTAATAALTASNVDTTPGRALKTGDFGVGSDAVLVTNWNDAYNNLGGAFIAGNASSPGGTGVSINATGINLRRGGLVGAQMMFYNGDNQLMFRTAFNGFGPWVKVYHTGNTTRMADNTLRAI